MVRRFVSIALFALLTSCVTAAPPAAKIAASPARGTSPEFGNAFWKLWGDGRAEMAGYDFETPRYGSVRKGVAVTIFVTESFSNTLRVKADPGKHPKSDEYPVMKLNLVQDFATGVYDYNLMTSAFTAVTPVNGRPAGAPTKVSFSAQEWCGHAFSQLLFDANAARFTAHSYFDGEADQSSTLPIPLEAVSEDALLVWARGLAYPVVKPGESVSVPLVRSLRESRLLHKPQAVAKANFARVLAPQSVTVPAGTFACAVSTVSVEGGRQWTFFTETAAPGRIVKWSCSDGELAQLIGSDRLPYWKLNGPGGEAALAKLGLRPRGPRTP
ncbi:MAG: hypothetical protein ABIU54_12930 [Candidatus Eisenbacteria bacterium]